MQSSSVLRNSITSVTDEQGVVSQVQVMDEQPAPERSSSSGTPEGPVKRESLSIFSRTLAAARGTHQNPSSGKEVSSVKDKASKDARQSRVGFKGMLRGMGLGTRGNNRGTHMLLPASTSEMSGWLHKQGYKVASNREGASE